MTGSCPVVGAGIWSLRVMSFSGSISLFLSKETGTCSVALVYPEFLGSRDPPASGQIYHHASVLKAT